MTLINDLFGSPPVWLGLDRRISQAWHDVRDYARDVLSGAKDDVEGAGMLFAAIAGLGMRWISSLTIWQTGDIGPPARGA